MFFSVMTGFTPDLANPKTDHPLDPSGGRGARFRVWVGPGPARNVASCEAAYSDSGPALLSLASSVSGGCGQANAI